jgi:hypothetical protein
MSSMRSTIEWRRGGSPQHGDLVLGDMLRLKNPFDFERGANLAPLPQCRDNQAALLFAIKSSNGFVVCLKKLA